MRSYTHVVGAILLFFSFAYLTSLNYVLFGMLFAVLTSLFPDIIDNLSGVHRGWGHSIILVIPFLLVGFWSVTLGAALFIGLISHLVLDVLTTRGCPIFYPFSKTNFVILKENRRIKTGTNSEKAIFILLLFLLGSVISFTFFMIHTENTPINFNTFLASGANETNKTNGTTITNHNNMNSPHNSVNINLDVKNKVNKNISLITVNDNETDCLIREIKPGG